MMKKKNRSSHTHLMGPNSPSSSPAPERSRPSTLFRLLLDAQAPQAADRQEPPDSSLSRTNRDAPASSSLADGLLKQKIQSRPLSQGFTLSLSLKLINSETSYLCEAHSDYWNIGHGYRLVSLQDNEDGGGLVVNLLLKKGTYAYGPDIPRLRLFVKHETRNRLRVHITDAEYERWEVPYNLLPREEPPPLASSNQKTSSFHFTASEYSGEELIFSYISDPFGFAGKRRYTRDTLFNSTAEAQDPYGPMVFKDQYLEISTRLPKSGSLYGLGENTQPGGIRLQPNDPYTLYTTNISAINLNTDLYGSHPMYMDLRNGNAETAAHGVLLLNINGMNVFYRGSSLTYKIIGGVFDFFLLIRANASRRHRSVHFFDWQASSYALLGSSTATIVFYI